MPTEAPGVYADGRGGWYFKARLPKDPATGRREQVTKRGYRTAAEAALVDAAGDGLGTTRSGSRCCGIHPRS
jgi:Arm DNA-binding domain